MSNADESSTTPVTDKRQLVEYFAAGCKPAEQWRIGTEHEKFVYSTGDLRPLPYEGDVGIRSMLEGLQRFGWRVQREQGNVVALAQDGSAITLEPGGQLELSGRPLENIHETCREVHEHLHQCRTIGDELGVHMLGMGYQPKWPRTGAPWMPKERYRIMHDYMPTRGDLGLDMMLQTCTVQVNLDYSSEADMTRKFRVSLALQPVATALFANSPFVDGQPSGYLSYRAHTWTRTDPDRCGIPGFVFDDGMGFERWVEHALDVPMYFVYRDEKYIDAAGLSFRDFLKRRLSVLPGEPPTLKDWSDHLTTIYTEVRMKQFLEMRGADGGPWQRLCALPAFWTGLLYDSDALESAWQLVRSWTAGDIQHLWREAPVKALKTRWKGRTLQALAGELIELSRAGLRRRRRLNAKGQDESIYLQPLEEIVRSGRTPAEELLAAYHGRWHNSVDPVFTEYAY